MKTKTIFSALVGLFIVALGAWTPLYGYGVPTYMRARLFDKYRVTPPVLKTDVSIFRQRPVRSISAGHYYSLVLKADGSLWAWGENEQGQLGDNSVTDRNSPVRVVGIGGTGFLSGVRTAKGCGAHSLALLRDGRVVAWGDNEMGQLGDGTTDDKNYPVLVHGLDGARELSGVQWIACGKEHSLALLGGGRVVGWGDNSKGQVGVDDQSVTQQLTPVVVAGLPGEIADIAAAGDVSLALTEDGQVFQWGKYSRFEFNGSPDPVSMPSTSSIRIVSSNSPTDNVSSNLRAVDAAGLVWSWGAYGPSSDFYGVTAMVGMEGMVTAVEQGSTHSLYLKLDGTVWAQGRNDHGELGNGTGTDSTTPVRVSDLSNAVSISAGLAGS